MKKLLFLLPLLFTSCLFNNDDEMSPPEPIDPIDQLPPITMEGANTFGCLMNGEVWIPDVTSFSDKDIDVVYNTSFEELFFLINRINEDIDQFLSIGALGITTIGTYNLYYNDKLFTDFNRAKFYELDTLSPHQINISKFDMENKIVSGEFEFTAIHQSSFDTLRFTDGRFDVEYRD